MTDLGKSDAYVAGDQALRTGALSQEDRDRHDDGNAPRPQRVPDTIPPH